MYVCMYVCMCMCTCICMYVCMCVCVCVCNTTPTSVCLVGELRVSLSEERIGEGAVEEVHSGLE